MRYILLLTFFLSTIISSYAQEELVPIRIATHPDMKGTENLHKGASRDIRIEEFNYVIDTLDLPFFDDFTYDLIKRYNARKSDQNVTPVVTYAFTVAGNNPDTFSARYDTTYNILKTQNSIELIPTDPLELIRYDITTGQRLDTDTIWTNIIYELNQSSGIITFDTLTAEFQERNSSDTVFRVADDRSLWVTAVQDTGDRGPFINNGFAIDPLSQGVATFDGLDARGYPYDITSAESYGFADELESKPIRLDSLMEEVYLSFFYQAGGFGNAPDASDSLVLEFYSPPKDRWFSVWGIGGEQLEMDQFSQQVVVKVDPGNFFWEGFKFRFRNFATLSGVFDHWHLDYIRLDEDVDTNTIDTIPDVAFVYGPQTYFKEYTHVPYRHYLEKPLELQASDIEFTFRNFNSETVNVQALTCDVFDPNGNVIHSVQNTYPDVPELSLNRESLPIGQVQVFTEVAQTYPIFRGECRYDASPTVNAYRENDTIRNTYGFYDFYAYDDGTAEMAYALTGAGVSLAYEFNTAVEDTLKAILFNFPQTLHDENPELPMRLMVWKDRNSPPIFESEFTFDAQYTDLNKFVRYEFEDPIVVDGTFSIGYQQVEATKIYLGFDANTNAQDKIYFRVNDEWFNTSFQGSIMMRPDFGDFDYASGQENIIVKSSSEELSVYPNPASTKIQLEHSDLYQSGTLEIYSLDGTLIQSTNQPAGSQEADVSSLKNGLYILRFTDQETMRVKTTKLIISRL